MEDEAYRPADPDAARDFWLSCAKPLHKRGAMDKMPHVPAMNAQMRDVARKQDYWVSRTVFQMPENWYDRIDWSR